MYQHPQAKSLTPNQVDHIYEHFEYGRPLNGALVMGVKILSTFRRTMGRYVEAGAAGVRLRTYPV